MSFFSKPLYPIHLDHGHGHEPPPLSKAVYVEAMRHFPTSHLPTYKSANDTLKQMNKKFMAKHKDSRVVETAIARTEHLIHAENTLASSSIPDMVRLVTAFDHWQHRPHNVEFDEWKRCQHLGVSHHIDHSRHGDLIGLFTAGAALEKQHTRAIHESFQYPKRLVIANTLADHDRCLREDIPHQVQHYIDLQSRRYHSKHLEYIGLALASRDSISYEQDMKSFWAAPEMKALISNINPRVNEELFRIVIRDMWDHGTIETMPPGSMVDLVLRHLFSITSNPPRTIRELMDHCAQARPEKKIGVRTRGEDNYPLDRSETHAAIVDDVRQRIWETHKHNREFCLYIFDVWVCHRHGLEEAFLRTLRSDALTAAFRHKMKTPKDFSWGLINFFDDAFHEKSVLHGHFKHRLPLEVQDMLKGKQ